MLERGGGLRGSHGGQYFRSRLRVETLDEVGETGGNRALGEVHERTTLTIARRDAEALSATLRRDLIGPIVARVYGPTAPVPSISFAVDPTQDLDALTKRIDLMVRAGLPLAAADVRNLLGLPDPAPDAALMVPP